jgi:O-antigen ligase
MRPKVYQTDIFARVISIGIFPIFLFILPYNAIDPINAPKLFSLVTTACVAGSLGLFFRKSIKVPELKVHRIILLLFLIQALLVMFFSGANVALQFFGTFGRNTGFLTYISLAVLFYFSAFSALNGSARYLLNSLTLAIVISGIYGGIQAMGLDPVPWDNEFSPVIGFLGNPDFQAALLGILGTFLVAKFLDSTLTIKQKAALIFVLFLLLIIIYETRAKQGLLNFLAGLIVVFFVWQHSIKRGIVLHVFSLLVVCLTTLIVFGISDKGPLSSILHKNSVSARQFYWDAAFEMTINHPFFGVGLDSYGEWYRSVRTQEAATTFGPNSVSDVAHNVLLDLSSMGGVPLLFLYIVLNSLVLIAAIRFVSKTKKYDPTFAAIFAGWVAYQAQSLISINQIALATTGWILGGLIIGIEMQSRIRNNPKRQSTSEIVSSFSNDPKRPIALFFGLIIGIALSALPMISSIQYRSAVQSADVIRIQAAAYLLPLEPFRMYQIAKVLRDNELNMESLTVARAAVKAYPRSFDSWNLIYNSPIVSESEKTQALVAIKQLDPFNPDFKQIQSP